MKIRDIRTRVCRSHRDLSDEYHMRSGGKSGFEFIAVSVDVSWGGGGQTRDENRAPRGIVRPGMRNAYDHL
jgi:hypothetical protein